MNSDDYWVYERLKRYATRMEVVALSDLPRTRAIDALKRYRKRYFGEDLSPETLEAVYRYVGGRVNYLDRVAKSNDLLGTCRSICDMEKTWFYNKCWILGAEMDDDVMDEQKHAVSIWPYMTAVP